MTTIKDVEESWQRMTHAEQEHARLRQAYENEHAPYTIGTHEDRYKGSSIVSFETSRTNWKEWKSGVERPVTKIDKKMRVTDLSLWRTNEGQWRWRVHGVTVLRDGSTGVAREYIYEPVKEDA
jgi:hypothetical protein